MRLNRMIADDRLYNTRRYHFVDSGKGYMQVIPDEIRKCVVFLLYKDFEGEHLSGTGFLVSVELPETGLWLRYIVTAKHVIEGAKGASPDGRIYIRMNSKSGETVDADSLYTQWKYHPTDSTVDAAVLPGAPDPDNVEYMTLPASMMVTDELIKNEEIGAGDEVFLTGLFSEHTGHKRNLPIIRTGNIALMPEEKVYTKGFGEIDAYLVEARSIGGLSGSPVFVYLGYIRVVDHKLNMGRNTGLFYWLGLMHGHWNVDEADVVNDIKDTNGHRLNTGIGIVVPATKIMEIIEGPELMKERDEILKRHRDKSAPTEDSALNDQADGLTKEGFEQTLRNVTRKVDKPDEKKGGM